MLLDKWAARGCDPAVLAKIRKDVFDIDVPKPWVGRHSAVNSGAGFRPPSRLLTPV